MHAATREPAPAPPEGGAKDVELGRVQRPHGRDGGLLVVLYGDDPANLLAAPEVLLRGAPGEIPFLRRAAEDAGPSREGHARVRLWLQGITDRARAERWSGARLLIAEHLLERLPEGEFYWRDLIGTRCRLPGGETLGTVCEIWPTGSNDVLVIESQGKTVLVPATEEVLVRLDRAAGELWIDPPTGLLDDEPASGA